MVNYSSILALKCMSTDAYAFFPFCVHLLFMCMTIFVFDLIICFVFACQMEELMKEVAHLREELKNKDKIITRLTHQQHQQSVSHHHY